MARARRVVAAAVLVVHPVDRKVAVMRAHNRSGRISLLGGGVERGEGPAHAAIREGEEESGGSIRIERVRLLGVWGSDDGAHCAGYLATRWSFSTADSGLLGSDEGPAFWASRADLLSPVDSAFPEWAEKLFAAYDDWLRLPKGPGALRP